MKVNQLILLLIIMLLYILFKKLEIYLGNANLGNLFRNPELNIIIISFSFSLVLLILLCVLKKSNIIDQFVFEVTPAKLCDGGPYMWSSNPELQKFCSSVSEKDIKSVSCPIGYHGRPVHFNYTPESNSKWENSRCDGEPKFNTAVL